MRSAWLAWMLLSAALVPALAGCGSGGIQVGHELRQNYSVSTGDKPFRPGTELGLLDVYLDNTSDSTLILESVGIRGPGVGTVVRPVEVKIAPLRFGQQTYEMNAVPGGAYESDPPVFYGGRKCHRQALFPVKGYRMTPGSQVRVWIVVRGLRPGRWVVPNHVVYYKVGGAHYRQVVPLREYGSIAAHARYIPPDWATAKCVRPEHAHFLPGYHAGRVSY
jgi:hypothetical protein